MLAKAKASGLSAAAEQKALELAKTESRTLIRTLQKANVIGLTPEQAKRYEKIEKIFGDYLKTVSTSSKPVGRLGAGTMVKVKDKFGKVFVRNGKPFASFEDGTEIDLTTLGATVDVVGVDSNALPRLKELTEAILNHQTKDGLPLDAAFYKAPDLSFWGKGDLIQLEDAAGNISKFHVVGRDPLGGIQVVTEHQVRAVGLEKALLDTVQHKHLRPESQKVKLVSHGDFFTKFFDRSMQMMADNPLVKLAREYKP
jgi:hypothetical protein